MMTRSEVMKPHNFLVTGVGGQGTVLASDILAAVGLAAGYEVRKSDVLGLAVRGGSVISHIRWGQRVYSPIIPEGRVDILVAFEYLEGLRWLNQLKPEGTILVNRQRIFPVIVSAGEADYPNSAEIITALRNAVPNVHLVPGLQVAQELGNTRVLNIVLLGALSGLLEVAPEVWGSVIKERVPAKVADLNVQAFWRGRAVLAESALSEKTILEVAA
jgi:indolepyruvate ferredoxin oxidoreductase beta subunit